MSDPEFILLGDAYWLDFVNTGRGRTASYPDRIPDLAAYHRWVKAEKLRSDVDTVPFSNVLAFRQQLTGLAEALNAGRQAPAPAIAAINRFLAGERGGEQLVRVGGRWRLRHLADGPAPALAAIARSAAETLAAPSHVVRQCAGAPCTLFFLDSSPTQSRRWCSAAACGGRGRIERRRGLSR